MRGDPLHIPRRGFTGRALVVGGLLSAFLGLACPYSVLVMRTAGLTSDYATPGAMMLLFVLVALVNPLLKLLFGPRAFSTSELVLIYTMLIVASAVPTWGLVTNLLHILTRPFYYATPENAWTQIILPHIPTWLAPRETSLAFDFYNGLPQGEPIPWRGWVVPVVAWTCFMVAVWCVMVGLMVLFRRQWMEHERLAFPLTHPPLELLKGNDTRLLPHVFTTARFWIPFAIVFFLISIRPIRFRWPDFPDLPLDTWLPFFNRKVWVSFYWNFAIIGITYFINLDVAASLWVFHLVAKLQTGAFNTIGLGLAGRNEYLTASSPATAHQSMGAILTLVLVVVWRARHHLRDALRKALFNAPDVDDSGEILSYRQALCAIVFGAVFMVGWLASAGLSWVAAALFVGVALLLFFAVTRIVAVGGIGFTASPMLPQAFVVYGFGPRLLGPRGITLLALQYSWAAEYRTSVMTSSLNGMYMTRGRGAHPRRVLLAMAIAVFAGLFAALAITFQLSYTHGGANLHRFGVPWMAFDFAQYHIRNPITPQMIGERWLFTGIGAVIMWGLVFLRHNVARWPLHYIGFVMGDAWVMGHAWWSVFLGWLAKYTILRIGGADAYRRYIPVFLGLLFGQFVCGGFWMALDFCAGIVSDYVYIGA